MSFTLDFNDTFEGFEKVQDGTYEVIIDQVSEDATPGGAEYVNFRMVIRNDLDQPHKNQKLWHRVWRAKATGKYNMTMFNTIGKAARLENGKAYGSFEELLSDYEFKPVQVFVKNETSTNPNNGKEYENTNVKSWKETMFPNIQHQFKNDGQSNSNVSQNIVVDVQDDDLPF